MYLTIPRSHLESTNRSLSVVGCRTVSPSISGPPPPLLLLNPVWRLTFSFSFWTRLKLYCVLVVFFCFNVLFSSFEILVFFMFTSVCLLLLIFCLSCTALWLDWFNLRVRWNTAICCSFTALHRRSYYAKCLCVQYAGYKLSEMQHHGAREKWRKQQASSCTAGIVSIIWLF